MAAFFREEHRVVKVASTALTNPMTKTFAQSAGKKPCSLAKGKDSPRTRGEDGIHQRPFFKKQYSRSRGNRKGDVEIGPVGKQSIHIGYPLIELNLGADVDGFHNGLNSISIPDNATNYHCPEGASCSVKTGKEFPGSNGAPRERNHKARVNKSRNGSRKTITCRPECSSMD